MRVISYKVLQHMGKSLIRFKQMKRNRSLCRTKEAEKEIFIFGLQNRIVVRIECFGRCSVYKGCVVPLLEQSISGQGH